MEACIRLAENSEADIVGCAHMIELDFLNGRKKILPYEAYSILHYDSE